MRYVIVYKENWKKPWRIFDVEKHVILSGFNNKNEAWAQMILLG